MEPNDQSIHAQSMKKVILEAQNVKKYFQVKKSGSRQPLTVKAVDDISMTIMEGETFGLVGETGCGKSTFGRTVLKLLEPSAGNILYKGSNIAAFSENQMRPLRSEMQMIFQDPFTSLNPRKQVGQILEEALIIQGMKAGREERGMEILSKVGLRTEHYFRYPHEFSGGQRQRIGIARALILNPSFVVCDEPVSALDVSIQSQIINLLLDLKEQQNLSYLFIAHDMSVVKYISDRIGVMYLGHLVEEAVTDDLFAMPLHPYAQALLSAVPSANPHISKQRIVLEGDVPSPMNPPSGCVFHTRCKYAMPICSQQAPCRREMMPGHFVSCHLYDSEQSEADQTAAAEPGKRV